MITIEREVGLMRGSEVPWCRFVSGLVKQLELVWLGVEHWVWVCRRNSVEQRWPVPVYGVCSSLSSFSACGRYGLLWIVWLPYWFWMIIVLEEMLVPWTTEFKTGCYWNWSFVSCRQLQQLTSHSYQRTLHMPHPSMIQVRLTTQTQVEKLRTTVWGFYSSYWSWGKRPITYQMKLTLMRDWHPFPDPF